MISLSRELLSPGNQIVFSMTNRDLLQVDGTGRIPRETLLIRRILSLVRDQVFEIVEVKNFDSRAHEIDVECWSGTRFDDLFEVRGFKRAHRGQMLGLEESSDDEGFLTIHQYRGLDERVRRTLIRRFFQVVKLRGSPGLAGYRSRVRIEPKQTVVLRTTIGFDRLPDEVLLAEGGKAVKFATSSTIQFMEQLHEYGRKNSITDLRFDCDNAIVLRSVENALTDITMLLTKEGDSSLYPYAGIPWFSAPFGRDGLIAAYQMLPWAPELARGVLSYVFDCIGKKQDPFTDEQPGKIFHEMRRGEMSLMKELPFIPYYGSVDSTPLSLIVLHEYMKWTGDLVFLRKYWPQALEALEWLRRWGASEGDGFLEYARRSPTGLVNQGWKDSHDSVMHASGELAQPPIRLCEAQAYSFKARMALSELAGALGDQQLSHQLRREALSLRARFNERFWDSDRGFVYLALDGEGRPCQVRSSNMGHCLWGELLYPEQAQSVVQHLFSEAMFSGYGIRTLADTEASYNPMSYHNGSIWPHDNSLIMEGLRKYGFTAELEKLSSSMLDVLDSSEDFRLPELYCGFRRRGDAPPVPYEVACKPQAWAAGSIFLMLKSMMGLSTELGQSYLVFNSPVLGEGINLLEIRGLRGPDWELDLIMRRSKGGTTIDVTRKTGNIRTLTVK